MENGIIKILNVVRLSSQSVFEFVSLVEAYSASLLCPAKSARLRWEFKIRNICPNKTITTCKSNSVQAESLNEDSVEIGAM